MSEEENAAVQTVNEGAAAEAVGEANILKVFKFNLAGTVEKTVAKTKSKLDDLLAPTVVSGIKSLSFSKAFVVAGQHISVGMTKGYLVAEWS